MRRKLIGKDPAAGKDGSKQEKGAAEDERLSITDSMGVCETLGDGEGQGSLASCSPWGHKVLDTTEQLNNDNSGFTSMCSTN